MTISIMFYGTVSHMTISNVLQKSNAMTISNVMGNKLHDHKKCFMEQYVTLP